MKRLDVSPWNLGLPLSMVVLAACGPVVPIDETGTDTDVDPTASTNPSDPSDPSSVTDPSDPTLPTTTTSTQSCYEVGCDYGYECIGGYCMPTYCSDGGCCYYDDGGCCYYDGCCYGDDGCWYDYCSLLTDCEGGEFCNGYECEPANMPSECAPLAFAAQVPLLPDGVVVSLTFVEADGDPARELAVGTSLGAGLTAVDAAAATVLPIDGAAAQDIGAGDLDGDGDLDLVIATAGPALVPFLNDGLGAFVAGASQPRDASRIEIADVDGDAIADLVGVFDVGSPQQQAAILRGLGGGEYDAPYLHSPDGEPRDLEVGELFGDVGAELVVFDGESTAVWMGGPLDGSADYWFGGSGGVGGALAIGDFDGDGLRDVARVTNWSGWTNIDVFHSLGAGGLESSYSQAIVGSFDRAEAADLDGDGRDDLVLAGSEGVFAVLPGKLWDYPDPFACVGLYESGVGGPVSLALGDYDGQGAPDVALSDGANTVVHLRTP